MFAGVIVHVTCGTAYRTWQSIQTSNVSELTGLGTEVAEQVFAGLQLTYNASCASNIALYCALHP